MQKFRINKFLDLRLEDSKTNIYVNNKLFRQCKYILLNIPVENLDISSEISSVDDAVELLGSSSESIEAKFENFTPEVIFWAHCSNLQAWHEDNYNSSLLHSNLSFPLLRELTKAGDLNARKIFKEEIAKRFESKNITVIKFLLYNEFLSYLNTEELRIVLDNIKIKFSQIIVNNLKELMISAATNYKKINDLIDLITFIDLKYNLNLIYSIINTLDERLRVKFARFLILHLNYKEFICYKIPYGKFFIYFESIIDDLYKRYPEINELLCLIESGFLSGSIALEEKYSYGTQSYP